MDISVKEMDSEVQIKILGSVKQSNVEILRETFDDVLTTTKKNVSIDLGFVSAMSSLGIGKLIYFHNELKIQNRKLTIVDINKSLNSLFNSMSLNQIFNFQG
ncbi:STAS domain-containing protein [candidate division KSB1 bacterium]|nr:STAS domain-containing protein [candidate division KSB1 bacterium]